MSRGQRHLSLSEVADCLGVKIRDPSTRRKRAKAFVRNLERETGRKYMFRATPRSPWLVTRAAIVELLPEHIDTVSRLRERVDDMASRLRRAHDRIEKLERLQLATTAHLRRRETEASHSRNQQK